MLNILIFLTFFGTTSADDGWLVAAKGTLVNFDVEDTPLEIKTDSKIGTDEKVYVVFGANSYTRTGGVGIKFSSPPTILIIECYYSYKAFPAADLNLAADNNNVWRVAVTRTSDIISLTVFCNDKEVLNYKLSDSVCDNSSWNSKWSGKKRMISFSSYSDTATDFYRTWKDPMKCYAPTIDDGRVFPSGAISPGSSYTLFCNNGFNLKGNKAISCTENNGKASLSTSPTCEKELKCGAPTVKDGKVSPSTDISPGSSYTVICNGGFTLKGNSDISCTENNGKASLSTSPSCEKELKCEVPTIGNGKVSPSTDISPGSSYTVTCNGGFTLKGNKDISCTENNGKASLSTSPSCEKDAKDDDKTKLSFANCLKVNAALLVVLITAALLI